VPADRGMEFDCAARRVLEADCRRVMVSVMVLREAALSTAMRDSIAAMAGVMDGSEEMRRL